MNDMPTERDERAAAPKFRRPPVIETVLGVQFTPLKLTITDYAKFHSRLIPRGFVKVQEQPRLEHIVERQRGGSGMNFLSAQFLFPAMIDLPRAWFLAAPTEEGQQLIQLQNDRLILNWRRDNPDSAKYTSYATSSREFEATFTDLLAFVSDLEQQGLFVDQCEIVYVNQIDASQFGSLPEALARCFNISVSTGTLQKAGAKMETAQFATSFWHDSFHGRLHVEISAPVPFEIQPMLELRITARGAPEGSDLVAVRRWLDLGHHYAVHTFADVTQAEMHEKWEIVK